MRLIKNLINDDKLLIDRFILSHTCELCNYMNLNYDFYAMNRRNAHQRAYLVIIMFILIKFHKLFISLLCQVHNFFARGWKMYFYNSR